MTIVRAGRADVPGGLPHPVEHARRARP
jgi:hypothetical protein